MYLAALNGTASGGGYELALACEHIMLIDDRSSAVSLPELPLLGVLPGTGGLTRVVDKRHVRRDRADYFSTKSEGLGGKKAVAWRLVDEAVPRAQWDGVVPAAGGGTGRPVQAGPRGAAGIELTPLARTRTDEEISYRPRDGPAGPGAGGGRDHRDRAGGRAARPAWPRCTSRAPEFWTLAVTRELDDLILDLRTNELELGTWVLRTQGDPAAGAGLRPVPGRTTTTTGWPARSCSTSSARSSGWT